MLEIYKPLIQTPSIVILSKSNRLLDLQHKRILFANDLNDLIESIKAFDDKLSLSDRNQEIDDHPISSVLYDDPRLLDSLFISVKCKMNFKNKFISLFFLPDEDQSSIALDFQETGLIDGFIHKNELTPSNLPNILRQVDQIYFAKLSSFICGSLYKDAASSLYDSWENSKIKIRDPYLYQQLDEFLSMGLEMN